MTNNLGEAPKTNNFSIFHPQFSWLYCLSLGIVLVFCVRREEYGMPRWLENAKYLPQIVHLQTVMQSLSLFVSLSHMHTCIRPSCLLSDSPIDMLSVVYLSLQHAKPKNPMWKASPSGTKHLFWVISLHHMICSYQLGKLFSMSKGTSGNHMGSSEHRGNMFWV